jgi:hypothetical protein
VRGTATRGRAAISVTHAGAAADTGHRRIPHASADAFALADALAVPHSIAVPDADPEAERGSQGQRPQGVTDDD